MKIVDFKKAVIIEVKNDNGELYTYVRYGEYNWVLKEYDMEYDLDNPIELEKLYQEYIGKK